MCAFWFFSSAFLNSPPPTPHLQPCFVLCCFVSLLRLHLLTGCVEPYTIIISPFTCTIFIVCLFALVFKGILVLDSKMQLTAGKSNDSIVECLQWQVVRSQRKFQYLACHVYQDQTGFIFFHSCLLRYKIIIWLILTLAIISSID